MKLLKIEDNHGLYLKDGSEFSPIDKISKDDLLDLVNQTLTEEVEFDEYDSDRIKNQAHQILYRNIFEKLQRLKDRKEEFTDESERLYLLEYEKYREEQPHQGVEDDELAEED